MWIEIEELLSQAVRYSRSNKKYRFRSLSRPSETQNKVSDGLFYDEVYLIAFDSMELATLISL